MYLLLGLILLGIVLAVLHWVLFQSEDWVGNSRRRVIYLLFILLGISIAGVCSLILIIEQFEYWFS